ncbi:hypothetical protein [Hoeflea poritis]|uniref:N-acetyltransferase domain-containing protein n=1 Tax=Hoeflea poritis TaxID=2993659 RepID=A0ABT4VL82_9HYPH|nr:hypothetical protein [Hoeflea poritis]MDA4844920.1 hypothetical protein [Hoeflea poritis]
MASAADIRPLERSDIPSVAALYQKVLLRSNKPAPTSLGTYLEEVFLDHPRFDAELPSRVCIDAKGAVDGFIGVLPAPMMLNGKSVRAAVAGSLMVGNPAENPLAGARLLRSVRSGPQDLSISETANDVSMGMWEQLGDPALPQYSLQWVRVFRPAGFATAALAERFAAARLLRPIASLTDTVARPLYRGALATDEKPKRYRLKPLEGPELIACLLELSKLHALHPDWDEEALHWMLDHAACKRRHGAMHSHAVESPGGKLLGCHICFARPGGIAWTLQLLAAPKAEATVIASLLDHAQQTGAVAIRGRVMPRMVGPLMRQKAFFLCNASTVIHTKNAEIQATIDAGDAFITGLAAESWIRLIGDRFE